MRRGWFAAGVGIGFGAALVLAVLMLVPSTRRSISRFFELWSRRVTEALREGVRAARVRETELEAAIMADELGLEGQGPDYVV